MRIFPVRVEAIEYVDVDSLHFIIDTEELWLRFPYTVSVKHKWNINEHLPELLVSTVINRFTRSPWFRLIKETKGTIRRQYLLLAVHTLVNRSEVDDAVNIGEGTINLALKGKTSNNTELAGHVWIFGESIRHGVGYVLSGVFENLVGRYKVIVRNLQSGETVAVSSLGSLAKAKKYVKSGVVLLPVATTTSRYLLRMEQFDTTGLNFYF